MKRLVILLLKGYKLFVSPFLGYRCRFVPSCAAYAQEAIEKHGVSRGVWLVLQRLGKCHPLYRGEMYDSVPEIIVEPEEKKSRYVR